MTSWWDEPIDPDADADPAPPVGPPPPLACERELLAALPPDRAVENAAEVFAIARHAFERVVLGAMTIADLDAFLAILKRHPDHEAARRFRRFAPPRQQQLEELLRDAKVRARARARERAQRAVQHRPSGET